MSSGSLTYEPFYGLTEKPFSLAADPRFWFRSEAHTLAFDALSAGIRRREGLIVLTGEIGTGKTTVCRSVLTQLDRRTFSAFVPDPFVSREDLLKTLLVDFGVASIADLTQGRFNGASRSDLSYLLYEFLDSLAPLQAFAVLVIDEAQNLSLPLLEEIRILSELERREKLLQVVLVGQPELRDSLKLPQMRQVDQRVSVRCELPSLDRTGTAGYVWHRLNVASSAASGVVFTPAALDAVYQASGGVPRAINRICDRALHHGYAARSWRIEPPFVAAALADLGLAPPSARMATAPPAARAVPRPAPSERNSDARTQKPFARTVRWFGAAAVALVALPGGIGGSRWYARVQAIDRDMAEIPAPPPAALPLPRLSIPAAPDAIAVGEAVSPAAAPADLAGPYAIVVASFTNPARAGSLVDELTRAGFRARSVERDWGPPRGRIIQVNVGGYTSAAEVQRDLQRIRELPGYADARIVERQ